MKLNIDDYQQITALLNIGVNEKAVTPQGDCVLIDESNIYAFNGTFYVNVPLAESLEVTAAVRFQKLSTFIKYQKSGSTFSIKPKKDSLLLKCGKIKQKLSVEDEILIPYSFYRESLSEATWKKIGINFQESLMHKAFTSTDQNNVLNTIKYNKKGVYSSNSIEVYYSPDSPIKTKEDVLIPSLVADVLSKVAEPFTHYTVCENIIAFRLESGAEIAFPKLVDDYPKIINTLLKSDIKGDELDLGESDLGSYMDSSSAVAELCATGTNKYKLQFAAGELTLSTASDKGSSIYKTEVHSDADAELHLSSSVLSNIARMGGAFTYDGSKMISIESPAFQYIAAVVIG